MGRHGHHHHNAAENALHRAEVREERRAVRDLAHGDVAGFVQHQQNANALSNMENAVHNAGHHHHGHPHHGHGAHRVERALHHAEVREEQQAIRDLAHGNVAGYVHHQQNANQIHNVEQAVHNVSHPHGHHHYGHHHHGHGIHGVERQLHRAEVREENQAIRDLAHGNVAGYVQHQQNAQQIHNVEQAIHHGHHPHHHHHHQPHYPQPCENTPLYPTHQHHHHSDDDKCCNCSIM